MKRVVEMALAGDPSVNLLDITAPVVIAAGVIGWAIVLSRVWRNEWKWISSTDHGGRARGTARARVFPVNGVALALLGVGFVCVRFSDGGVAFAVGLAFGYLALLAMAIVVSIALFNRPRRLVPPHLRHHPGAVREWLGRPVEPIERPRHRPLRKRSEPQLPAAGSGPPYACPVCGHFGLDVRPYALWPPPPELELRPPYEAMLGAPSYEVCPRCGFEFGNDDNSGTAEPVSFHDHRQAWEAKGRPWFRRPA